MADPTLAPLYPADDIEGAKARLSGFLVQYWGGPTTYSDERGHPRLRMRHAPFVIGEVEREAWFGHMARAVVESTAAGEIDEDDEVRLLSYFHTAAAHMVNAPTHGSPRP